MPKQKAGRSVTTTDRPRPTRTALDSTSAAVDFDIAKRVADPVDWSIWRAVYAGQLILAKPCAVCGRALTSRQARRAGVGARCAAKVAAQGGKPVTATLDEAQHTDDQVAAEVLTPLAHQHRTGATTTQDRR